MDDAMNDSKMIRAIAARFVSMLSNLSPCDNATNEFRTNDATPISTENVAQYIEKVFRRTQLCPECCIIAFVYAERLCVKEIGPLSIRTWKSVMTTSLLLASKVWDDFSMVNEDFSLVLPFTNRQINQWEVAFLRRINFDVSVCASYYTELMFQFRQDAKRKTNLPLAI